MFMKIRKMNKRAASIPIMILAFCTVALSLLSIGFFLVKQTDMQEIFDISNEIDKVHYEKLVLDFYLQDIFDKSSKGFDRNKGKVGFIEAFKRELRIYKDENGKYPVNALAKTELRILENDIIDYVDISDEISFRLNFDFIQFGKADRLFIEYNYDKTFSSGSNLIKFNVGNIPACSPDDGSANVEIVPCRCGRTQCTEMTQKCVASEERC